MAATHRVPDGTDGLKPYTRDCSGSSDGVHDLRVVGYVRGGRVVGVDCDQALQQRCLSCGSNIARPCGTSRGDRCLPCSARYRRRVGRIALSGMIKAGRRLYVLTLTAPGTDPEHDRWVPNWAAKGYPKRPRCGCRASAGLAVWNAGAGETWNRFATTMRREHPGWDYFRATEIQVRGAIHYHVPMTVPQDQVLDVDEIQRWAMAAGFGCTIWLDDRPKVEQLAAYCAKYVSKGASDRELVPWSRDVVSTETGELETRRRPTYRNYSQARAWGLTMRDCKEASRRAAEAAARLHQDLADDALHDALDHQVPGLPESRAPA